MPGFVRYFYEDGKMPSGTKQFFNEHGILTVHNIIAKCAAILMHKYFYFRKLLPSSLIDSFPQNTPTPDTMGYEENREWLDIYGTHIYTNSLYFKAPLLYSKLIKAEPCPPSAYHSLNNFKNHTKKTLLNIQKRGENDTWAVENFTLLNISGLRSSNRLIRDDAHL